LTPIDIASQGTYAWSGSSTLGFGVGTFQPTASLELSASECPRVYGYTSAFDISAPAEVCPVINLTGVTMLGEQYGNFVISDYNNPTGLQLNFTASIAVTGSGISEVGYVIDTNTTPTVSGSANKSILGGSGNSNLAKSSLDLFISPNMSQSINPVNHTYLLR